MARVPLRILTLANRRRIFFNLVQLCWKTNFVHESLIWTIIFKDSLYWKGLFIIVFYWYGIPYIWEVFLLLFE